MPSISDYSPLRYRPHDPHMGRWRWDTHPEPPTTFALGEPDTPIVATIEYLQNGCWQPAITNYSEVWLELATPEASKKANRLLTTQRSLNVVARNTELALSEIVISAGIAPDPAHVPIIFMLGKKRSSQNHLKHLEQLARDFISNHQRGSLARLPDDAKGDKTNPVAQARALDQVFQLQKGHWPPSTDVFDECISLDSRYAPEYLETAANMALGNN